ncbi:hypothetical protein G3N59_10690 [Paraburkholderia sp. Ac-20340]|uniref:hypothetical protein n=1 Tax=Paraburkholderia sp. Ac-20340 TaxID=2703888 RepID=UPI00197CDBC3|nr:hypothetical protein [Paraburkholderia sp. Ac-20340]MBN3853846.1 hypothetical protein [Paraburkholderia sp. Ac-20340]
MATFPQKIDGPGAVTLDPNFLNAGDLLRTGLTGPVTDLMPASTDCCAAMIGYPGTTFSTVFNYINNTDYPLTLAASDSDMTIVGSPTIAARTLRKFSIASTDGKTVVCTSIFSQSGFAD